MKLYGHPRFYELIEEMKQIHSDKNHDYAGDNDPLANFKASKRIGIDPFIGANIRLQDKVARIENFIKTGEFKVKGESLKDTYIDLANYALLSLILFEESEMKK